MKKLTSIFLTLSIAGNLSGCMLATLTKDAEVLIKPSKIDVLWERFKDPEPAIPIVVAHRSCWADGAPENSLSAIQACIDMGVDMIEIDVALTSDGLPILFHDKTLARMTGQSGEISSFSAKQVLSFNLKEGAGGLKAQLTNQTVPTLREALELARGEILINLDVKGPAFDQAFEVVKDVGVSDQILMKMRAMPDSKALKTAKFLGKVAFMPVIGECEAAKPEKVCAAKLSEVIDEFEVFQPVAYEIVFANKQYLAEGRHKIDYIGKPIWVNTLAPKLAAGDTLSAPLAGGYTDQKALSAPSENWGAVVNLGADIIQTDNPKELVSFLRNHE